MVPDFCLLIWAAKVGLSFGSANQKARYFGHFRGFGESLFWGLGQSFGRAFNRQLRKSLIQSGFPLQLRRKANSTMLQRGFHCNPSRKVWFLRQFNSNCFHGDCFNRFVKCIDICTQILLHKLLIVQKQLDL
jgi:hypothetical protein